jgi:hypothetical protein
MLYELCLDAAVLPHVELQQNVSFKNVNYGYVEYSNILVGELINSIYLDLDSDSRNFVSKISKLYKLN